MADAAIQSANAAGAEAPWRVSISVFPDSQVTRMVGPSVFPDSRVEKSSFETQNELFGTDFKSEETFKYILDIT